MVEVLNGLTWVAPSTSESGMVSRHLLSAARPRNSALARLPGAPSTVRKSLVSDAARVHTEVVKLVSVRNSGESTIALSSIPSNETAVAPGVAGPPSRRPGTPGRAPPTSSAAGAPDTPFASTVASAGSAISQLPVGPVPEPTLKVYVVE